MEKTKDNSTTRREHKPFKRVVVESPYGAKTEQEVECNLEYARACIKDCFKRGEAALASHLLYTQPGILDDKVKEQRELGIRAGFTWNQLADKIVVYCDRGVSRGMREGIQFARKCNIPVEYRQILGEQDVTSVK